MDDEIAGRIERLSPEARALFWEVVRRGEETEFRVPPDELVVNLHQRMASLPLQDRAHALGWGEVFLPNRPKTFARSPHPTTKVTGVSIYDKGPEPESPDPGG